VIAKSIIYLFDLYFLMFEAAFSFEDTNTPIKKSWFYFVSAIHIVDMLSHFFTAVRTRELSERGVKVADA